MSDCDPFVGDDLVFPRRPWNRPGLSRLRYRIAEYPGFLEAMIRGIDGWVELSAWTHRAPDDPAIALLEGAALVGDVLTFYHERYANEAFLRTAGWRESVNRLVRLVGYRPAPGLGGRTTFALEVKGERPVAVPAGFPVKAELEELKDPADFLTSEEVTAHPHLSRFHLYRHRVHGSTLPADTTRVEVATVGGAAGVAAVASAGLRAGDRIVLVAPEPPWAVAGSSFSATQPASQVVEVKEVTSLLGRTILELEAPLVRSWSAPALAFRVGRSFRHFGHNAPPTHTTNVSSSGVITGAAEHDTEYGRHVDASHTCTLPDLDGGVAGRAVPLDRQADDLAVGGRVLVQARVQDGGSGPVKELTVVRTVEEARADTLTFAGLTGPSTVLELDHALNRNGSLWDLRADVRGIRVQELSSPPLTLRPIPDPVPPTAFASGADALTFFGTLDEVRALAGRRLLLEKDREDPVELTSVDHADDFSLPAGADPAEPRMWTVSFDRSPAPLVPGDFEEAEPTVAVSGNLVDADQGKDRGEVALGNGDARAVFQTFPLPASPLTWLPASGATPPRTAELEVRVQGRLWTRVDSFFGRGPREEVYIVREDDEGTSYVQFGDGTTGARLPSGVKNVTAAYRTGTGAHGPAKEGKDPSAGTRLEGLHKVRLPGLVTGGANPEEPDTARRAAPGRVQALGRLVSLKDFETEALTVGGVTTATASWDLHDGVPALVMRVLLQAGREGEFEDVRATLQEYQRCRGADRFPVVVEQATLRYAFLDLRYAYEPALPQDDVVAAIEAALGLVGDEETARSGLFGLHARRLGAPEYARRVEAVVQNVEGVTWCRVDGLGLFAAGSTDPGALALPAAPRSSAERLSPGAAELLQLHSAHLVLASAPPPAAGECES